MRDFLFAELNDGGSSEETELLVRMFEAKYLYGPLTQLLCNRASGRKVEAIQRYIAKCFDLANLDEKLWIRDFSQMHPKAYAKMLEVVYISQLLESIPD